MKKKLLIATDCFLPRWDGIARFLNEVIPYLSEKYDITIIAPHYGKLPHYKDVKVITFPTRKLKIGDYNPPKTSWKKIKGLVRETDMVFVQTQGPIGSKALFAAKRLKVPAVSYVHSIEWELFSKSVKRLKIIVKLFTKWYARYLYNMSDMLMLPFLELKEIMKRHGVHKPEMLVVNLGTDTNKFSPPEDKPKAKEKIGINPNKMVIGFTGRISREKDLPTLVEAFKQLEKEYEDIVLLVVGKGLKSLELELKATKNIMLVGHKNDVVPYLQAMDIYVLPSLTETTSLSTIEAMSCALPVVVTPVGYVKDYVKDRHNGLIFPKGNALVLKLKLKQLLKDKILREEIGKQARATVIRKFNWEETIERLMFLLDQF